MPAYIVHKAVELSALSQAKQADATVSDWIISPKYDGCHAVFLFDHGALVNVLSRSGETVRSMPHIAQSLLDNYPLGLNRIAVCGEAWILGKEFNEVSGAFRRHAPQPQLGFVPFDLVPFDYADDTTSGLPVLLGQYENRPYPTTYRNRLSPLARTLGRVPGLIYTPRWITLENTSLSAALVAATHYAQFHKGRTDSFFDGAMLARADGKYIVGSGKGGEFIKVKPLISYTVTVTGAGLDFGTKTGKNTASLKFVLDGMEQKVSTGLTQQQVDEITAVGWVGYRIEVEAMGLTSNGMLREPRFKGVRTDA